MKYHKCRSFADSFHARLIDGRESQRVFHRNSPQSSLRNGKVDKRWCARCEHLQLWSTSEHGDPHFLFHNFDKNTIFNLCKKNQRISMFRFFINSIKSCGESITGPEEHTQIESILEHKVIKNALKYIFLTRRGIKERIKSDSNWSHWLHLKHWVFLPKIGWVRRWSKGAVLAVFVSIVLPKRARWPPFFITFLSSPRLDTTVWKFSSEIYVRFFY